MTDEFLPLEPDPVIEAYKKDVDRTLIQENLRRSLAERMQALLAMQRFFEEAQRVRRAEMARRI